MDTINSISGVIFDVLTKTQYKGEIHIKEGRIIDIRKKASVNNQIIMPGFIDAHIHIESSMLTPYEFSRLALRHGTVGSVSDPHEIANILGMRGIEFMIENGGLSPFKFYFGAPSCVPATPFESSGSEISSRDVDTLLQRDDILYLAEMMNYPGVLAEDKEVISKLELAKKYQKPIDGHAPGLRGNDLEKYIGLGISTDHECLDYEEAEEKIRKGMKILIREGSASKSFNDMHRLIQNFPEKVMLCSDDMHPDELEKGHLNALIKRGLGLGLPIFNLLEACVLNPVRHYGLDVGLLRVGDDADFIVINNLEEFKIEKTVIKGGEVFDGSKVMLDQQSIKPVNNFYRKDIDPVQLGVPNKHKAIKVICARDRQLYTGMEMYSPPENHKYIQPDLKRDILKIAVVNRYDNSNLSLGFINGFGLKKGAMASSIAHDSHNIVAVGTGDMVLAEVINEVIKSRGGLCIHDGNLDTLPLPVAGIMSDACYSTVIDIYKRLKDKAISLGCTLNAPFMTLSFMALLVIPELKLSDRGLFDGNLFSLTSLYKQE